MARDWKVWTDDDVGDSPMAQHLGDDVDDLRRGRERRANEAVDTLVVHMTGRSIVAKALRRRIDPLEAALSYYTSKRTSSHYLLGWSGELWQMTDDRIRVGHVGVSADERRAYLDGRWQRGNKARGQKREWLDAPSSFTVRKWREAWPHYKSPQHLFRTASVNNVSVGVEMPPCRARGDYLAEPHRPGLWHTTAQHVGITMLACDLADRWSWRTRWYQDPKGGLRTTALPGHEDVDLYGRSQKSGGWDPGALRASPRWDWPTVHSLIGLRLLSSSIASFLRRVANSYGAAVVKLF